MDVDDETDHVHYHQRLDVKKKKIHPLVEMERRRVILPNLMGIVVVAMVVEGIRERKRRMTRRPRRPMLFVYHHQRRQRRRVLRAEI